MTRYPLTLAVLAAALAVGACGGNGGTGGAASGGSEDKAFEGALKFSECMRKHGVTDFPDPKRVGKGGINIAGPRSGKRISGPDPKMKAAEAACRHFMDFGGGGPKMSPAEQARLQDAFFAYARCMRSKGIEMPDPKVSSQGVQMRLVGPPSSGGPKVPNPESPAFRSADRGCHHFLAQVEKKAGGAGPSLKSTP